MAKIYCVIQTKLNQLVLENVRMIADLPTKQFKCCHSDKHFSQSFYLQNGRRQKSNGIDMERNYVTVTHISCPARRRTAKLVLYLFIGVLGPTSVVVAVP